MKKKLTKEQILKAAKWDNNTAYTAQLVYICPEDKYRISAVFIQDNCSRQAVENLLVQRVLEHYGLEVE